MNPYDLVYSGQLAWFPDKGYGYVHPVSRQDYGQNYYEEYRARANNDVSRKLMGARLRMVNDYTDDTVLDIGAGFGAFVEYRIDAGFPTLGYDVNPWTVHHLMEKNWFHNLWSEKIQAASFWDVLEHLPNPDQMLTRILNLVFISIPIFRDHEHALTSKHYKPGEHLWYFTQKGLIQYMVTQGFLLLECNRGEEEWREDIGSYVFKRVDSCTEGATC